MWCDESIMKYDRIIVQIVYDRTSIEIMREITNELSTCRSVTKVHRICDFKFDQANAETIFND